jgi:hypothetical protein
MKLRQKIRKFAINQSKLLDSIGYAEMNLEIQRRVMIMTKENEDDMIEETGIQLSLTEEDIKAYLEQVLREIGHK